MTISDLLSSESVEGLLKAPAQPCVSLYMPTFRAGAEIQQNPIRFKNLMERAREQLGASGVRGSAASKLLAPLEEQQHDTLFWRYQADGLAVFHNPERSEIYRLPLKLDEQVVVGDRFHLKPLFNRFFARCAPR